jgi:hypothetical protein
VLQHGPKHLVLELAGIPFAQSTYYRGVVLTQTKAIMGLFCRALFVKPARPRSPSPESFAMALNWV